jgi:hypothetical protein
MKAINVNKLTRAGCTFKFWVADWFAQLNNKMGGDLKKIQTVGRWAGSTALALLPLLQLLQPPPQGGARNSGALVCPWPVPQRQRHTRQLLQMRPRGGAAHSRRRGQAAPGGGGGCGLAGSCRLPRLLTRSHPTPPHPRYMVEVWKAVGMDLTRVEFLNSSEEINSRPNEYWTLVGGVRLLQGEAGRGG